MYSRAFFTINNNGLYAIAEQLRSHHQARWPCTHDQYFGMRFRDLHFYYLRYIKKITGRLCSSGIFFCHSAMVLVWTNSVAAVRSQAMQSLVFGLAVFKISSSKGLLRKGVSMNICVWSLRSDRVSSSLIRLPRSLLLI